MPLVLTFIHPLYRILSVLNSYYVPQGLVMSKGNSIQMTIGKRFQCAFKLDSHLLFLKLTSFYACPHYCISIRSLVCLICLKTGFYLDIQGGKIRHSKAVGQKAVSKRELILLLCLAVAGWCCYSPQLHCQLLLI